MQLVFEAGLRGIHQGPGRIGAGNKPREQRWIERGRAEPLEIGL
jgi:hypothetical protein